MVRLAEILGDGANLDRFTEALTHPSFANETQAPDNQRLEFLGDSVLGLCVSELLGEAHPEADEGALTRMRSALVNAEALAAWGRKIDLGASIALGKGARLGSERDQTNVLADAVEALVACVYVARGIGAARTLVTHLVGQAVADQGFRDTRDPKSLLQERAQADGSGTPTYRVKSSRGPEHDPVFVVEVLVGAEVAGVGEGRSKRAAERQAAIAALESQAAEDAGDAAPATEQERTETDIQLPAMDPSEEEPS